MNRLAWILPALMLVACSKSSSVFLEVNSDLVPPKEIDSISIEVHNEDGVFVQSYAETLTAGQFPAEPALYEVSTDEDDADSVVRVATVRGLLKSKTIVETVRRFRFAKGKTLRLLIPLYRDCVSVMCPAELTCAERGECVPPHVPPEKLVPHTEAPSPWPPPGYGPRPDAGVDALGSDAKVTDGATDTTSGHPDAPSLPDAGPPDTAVASLPEVGPDVAPKLDVGGCNGMGLVCDTVAACERREGGAPTCVCPTGYRDDNGDGTRCTDIDECATANGGCHADADCMNKLGGRTCTCKSGFRGDGFACIETTPPTVTKVTPENDATGVWRSTPVELRFSEPMDKESVEAALTVTTGPQNAPVILAGTMSWDAPGQELTFKSTLPLPYDATVTVTLATTAKDLAGNTLAAPTVARFRVVRRGVLSIRAGVPYGLIRVDGFIQTQNLVVGEQIVDGVEGANLGFLTFDVTDIPRDSLIVRATARLRQSACRGTTWSRLGNLLLEYMDFGDELDVTDYDAPGLNVPNLATLAYVTPIGVAVEWKYADVSAILQDALIHRDERKQRLQFRVRFEKATVIDAFADSCSYGSPIIVGSEPSLDIEFEYR